MKQMLIHNLYNDTKHSALAYPSNTKRDEIAGTYQKRNYKCSLHFIPLDKSKNKIRLDLSALLQFIAICKDQFVWT
jgi:hypothetical protein